MIVTVNGKYGDKKLRRRAKKYLRANLVHPSGIWRVEGGEAPHLVTVKPIPGDGFLYLCDCEKDTKNGCSHIIAVAHYLEPDRSYSGRGVQDG